MQSIVKRDQGAYGGQGVCPHGQSIVKNLGANSLPLHQWNHLLSHGDGVSGSSQMDHGDGVSGSSGCSGQCSEDAPFVASKTNQGVCPLSHCAFLDSSLKNNLGQFSILGAFPYLILEDRDGVLYENGEAKEGIFIDRLRDFLQENKSENITKLENDVLPLTAGGIVYFTYDYGRGFENIKSQHKKDVQMPDARAAFYDLLLIQRESDGCLFLCTEERLHSAEWYEAYLDKLILENAKHELVQDIDEVDLNALNTILSKQLTNHISEKGDTELSEASAEVTSDFLRDDYYTAIQRMIDYMEAGHIYVANMTRQILVRGDANPLDVFEILREKNPSPFGGYIDLGDTQIICASPERFLKVTDGLVKTRPIKGTRKRGATPEEDAFFRKELEDSDKDKSELLMIVDLERNDLNRICLPGTVKVPEMFTIEEYATVFHLVSEIHGQLLPGKNAADLLKETFPGGSITGTPKIRAMEIIDELEHSARGLYTGSIGYLSLDGDCDLNIVIRTAVHQDGVFHIGAGGGITYESDVEFEYEETNQKAQAVVDAIRRAARYKAEKI